MLEWIVIFAGATAIAAAIFVGAAVMWLRKLRETVSAALNEAADQQLRTAQRLGEAIGQVQKQQRNYEQQLQNLAQAGMKLRQEIATVVNRIEHSDGDAALRGDRTLH